MPIWKFTPNISGEGGTSFLEDALLDLSAYHEYQQNIGTFLRAHDGVDLFDLSMPLYVVAAGSGEVLLNLEAYHQYLENIKTDFMVVAQYSGVLHTRLEAQGLGFKDFSGEFAAAGYARDYLGVIFEAEDNEKRWYFTLNLEATDGAVTTDLGMKLFAVGKTPAFQSSIAQRLSSVKTRL